MRLLTIIFIGILLLSCSASRNEKMSDDFKRYLSSLETLKTPVTFDTRNGAETMSNNYDTLLFNNYKHIWAVRPSGKIFENDSVIVIVDIAVGEVIVPLIMTYDRDGHKLDSLNPIDKAGDGMGYESYEYGTITARKEIIVVDSTTTSNINEKGDDIVEGTEKLTVDTVIYRIDNKGRFKKVKR